MPLTERTTLVQFLIEQRRRFPQASGELNAVILNIALACKAIARSVAYGAPVAVSAATQAPPRAPLAQEAEAIFVRNNDWAGHLAAMATGRGPALLTIPDAHPRGKYLLAFAPLDGAADGDVNGALGSIFSVLHAPRPGEAAGESDFLQPGSRQVCAGYAMYGPATMLVLSVGDGVHGFTLDPLLGEFKLTHPNLRILREASEFSISSPNSRHWEPALKRYVDECMAGGDGARGRDFRVRWIASLVAELHRVLLRGGVFMYPRTGSADAGATQLRLLFEANPIAFVAEQAGGSASTGTGRVLDTVPESLAQTSPLLCGASGEIERLERYHLEHNERSYDAPLFGARGLFRGSC